MVRHFFTSAIENIRTIYSGERLFLHLLVIGGTYLLVMSGFDWWYFTVTRDPLLIGIFFPSAGIGPLVSLIVPLALLSIGSIYNHIKTKVLAFAIAQSIFIGLIVSGIYKALSGRAHPDLSLSNAVDITREFHFGMLDGGVFWGWPSTHTTLAFGLAGVVWILFPHKAHLRYAAFLYALYIGIGVSMTIHWFSDFFAGAILGTLIGLTVGRSFLKRFEM